MQGMSSVKRSIVTALMMALCVVLPMAFHAVPNGGTVFLPMHIPILICGMICGWPYGLLCGLMGPALSSLISGMPALAVLPAMMVECAAYGLITGLLMKFVRTGKLYGDLYLALIVAMIAGRVLSGIAKALIFSPGITMKMWVTASFVTAIPGIVIQLIAIPLLVDMLIKVRYMPVRYRKVETHE